MEIKEVMAKITGRSVAMKALKLPPFNEDKDDLDAYLTRFERACTVSEQFLHGTSAQYRLCSAILLKLYKS